MISILIFKGTVMGICKTALFQNDPETDVVDRLIFRVRDPGIKRAFRRSGVKRAASRPVRDCRCTLHL